MFKLNEKGDADSLLYLLSHFDATATQYTCSLSGIYRPHWLVQWGHHCSHMRIPVYSPWLPGYINVPQTDLIILTMAGLLPDRPCRIFWTNLEMDQCSPPLLLYTHLSRQHTFTSRYPYGFFSHSFKVLFNIMFSRKLSLSIQNYPITLSLFIVFYFSILPLSFPGITYVN